MRGALVAVLVRELARARRGPLVALLVVVLPLASFALLAAVFSARVPRDLPVVLVDLDDTPLSRRLARFADATPSVRLAERTADAALAERRLLEGRAYAVFTVPAGFERNVLRGGPSPVLLATNSQWLLPASLIRRDLTEAVGTLSAGVEIRTLEARGSGAALARERFEPVHGERHALFNPGLDYLHYLLVGLLPTMLQIFVLVAGVQAVGSELREGSAGEWLDAGQGRIGVALFGKLLPYATGYLGIAAAMLAGLFGPLGVPRRGSATLLLVASALFVLAYLGLGALLAALFGNLRLATSAAAFVATPAFAFVGLTFPTMAMPPLAQVWGAALPLTHYLRLLLEQAMRGAPPADSFAELAVLGGFALVAPWLALPRLARLARNPAAWGRS
ncbi:MAG: ABC transporter permease [Holophagales bacterium]|nr:MAG: ABC transporter permease [Holophagales bacterium]